MNWQFEEGTHTSLQEATKNAFSPISSSAVLDLGHQYNWIRNGKDHWGYDFRKIAEVSAKDQFGTMQTWNVELQTRGGIMQSAEGCSRWAIRIKVIDQ